MQSNTPDRQAIDMAAVGELTADQLEALSLHTLCEIISWVERTRGDIRSYESIVNHELARRFQERAAQVRSSQAKSTGTVRFAQGEFTVVADLVKKVEYDQVQLKQAVTELRQRGQDPEDFVVIEINVPESNWHQFAPGIRELFERARTVKTGRQSFKLIRLRADEIPAPSNDPKFGVH
jgi:hypothetical protein